MTSPVWKSVFPGVWSADAGNDPVTLTGLAGALLAPGLKELPETELPSGTDLKQYGDFRVFRIPIAEEETVFGGGLLFQQVIPGNAVFHLRADHFGGKDNGRTHAPVPFAVTSSGVGIFCDTPEEVTLYIGTAQRIEDKKEVVEHDRFTGDGWKCYNPPFFLEISVRAEAARFVLFRGTNLKDCVARFNLYCGGGCLPPKWGLGLWHRTNAKMTAEDIRSVAAEYRKRDFPLSVIGLEPGWQTGSYPCTYVWSEDHFPDPAGLIRELKEQGIRVNLWCNGYLSEKSPVYEKLLPLSGSHLVWCGIAPDLTLPEARTILKKHFEKEHLSIGVSGYKLDESDGHDQWLWPDHARFPSGHSGFAVRNVYGLMFQKLASELFRERGLRTYGLTRSTNGGGVSFPFVLYNDCYDFREFLTGVCSSGFTGSLWCPELRRASSASDWLRRFQLAALSPMLLLNAWASASTPWMYPEAEGPIREAVQFRQKLMPYLYSAFARYHFEGIPPWRSLFMDYGMFLKGNAGGGGQLDDTANPYQEVKNTDIRDQFLFGDTLMAAPLFPDENSRTVIFPPGKWYDFYTGEFVSDGGVMEIRRESGSPLPVYAPDGAVVPLEENGKLEIRKFGTKPGRFLLYEDDGLTFEYEQGKFHWTELKA